jgi:hypothetical protein
MSDSVVETFDQLVRHRPMPELVDLLLSLDKPGQVAVRLHTKALYKELNDWRNDSAEVKKLRNRTTALFLAGLATYTKQEAMGRSFELPWGLDLDNAKDNRGYKEHFLRVVRHARPAWLTDWLVRLTRTNPWSFTYGLLRELEAESLLSYDPWLAAQLLGNRLNHYNRTGKERGQSLAAYVLAQLQADATLLARDLPLLFDYDTAADSASIYLDKNRPPITWLTLLPQLVASGHLERADLLTRCLLALRRDFRRPLLTWFKNVFLSFAPSPAERLARQQELLELLAHPLPLVVNFALDQLKDLWAAPDFATESLLLYADALMSRQDLKTGLKTLLGGFGKLLKTQPAHAPALAGLCAVALAQADSAVQERAAKLLADLLHAKKPLLTPAEAADLAATIPTYAALLAPPARAVLAPWLAPAAAGAPADAADAYAPLTDFAPDISPATAIAPVADWHELLFLTGQVLKYDDPAAFERWLDGLLQLRGQFPAGFAEQLQPYLKQAFPWELRDLTPEQQALTLRHYQFGGNHVGEPEFIKALLASWAANFEHPRLRNVSLAEQPHNHPDPLLALERQRLAVAEARLHPASPTPGLPLLSTPSHAPHWVAPTALVARLLAHEAAGLLPDPADLALALARTAFAASDDAAEACRQLPRLAHADLRELLGWFLSPSAPAGALPYFGPSVQSVVKSLADRLGKLLPTRAQSLPVLLTQALPWLWAVAARTRHPAAELPALRPLADYPGLAAPWQPGWYFEPKSRTDKYPWNKQQPEVTTTWTELTVATEQPGQRPPSPLALYSLHARLRQDKPYYLWSLAASLPFLLTLVPNNPAPLHWHVLRTACRTDSGSSEGRAAVEQVLHTLLAPGPVLAEGTTALLAVALTHAAPVCRALALEVLLATVAQRRLVPAALGAALGRLLGAGFVPVQRLADGLAELRAIDAATDDALTQTLAALLPELPAEPPRNTRKLLEAYADLVGRTRQPVPAPVLARLREWPASASLKKAAAPLLAG